MNRLPLIVAIVLLLLPVLYVGSYFALVDPADRLINDARFYLKMAPMSDYRSGGNWESRVFWPIERIDRKLRPGTWEPREGTRLVKKKSQPLW